MAADNALLTFLSQYYTLIIALLFVVIAVAEFIIPGDKEAAPIRSRWLKNFGLMLTNYFSFKVLGVLFALFSALLAEYVGFGLLNNYALSLYPALILGVLVLDFKQYLLHRLVHWLGFLWQVHRVHHSDLAMDLSTGFRFHPFEALLSQAVHIAVIMLFGLPVEAVVLWQLLTYYVNFFTHANIKIPVALDRGLRWIIVTPEMHRIHHTVSEQGCNSNFGALLSVWDRLFGSYTPGNAANVELGISGYREASKLPFWRLLVMPFKS